MVVVQGLDDGGTDHHGDYGGGGVGWQLSVAEPR
jgi:hypothetical protein